MCRRSLILSWLAFGMWQPAAQGAPSTITHKEEEEQSKKKKNMSHKAEQGRRTFASTAAQQGFSFSYPASFVIAYDRTQDTSRDGAIISIGNFTNTIHTATVFRQRVRDVGLPQTPEDAYKLCIQPLIDDASTTGFRLIQDSLFTTEDNAIMYEYEYEQSVCRGQEIVEGVGGVLRCTGTYGQDVPIQTKRILARTLFLPEDQSSNSRRTTTVTLLTMQASTNDDTMRAIIDSFIPL
ncbi:hypothetical protein M9434_006989 [Picochlorum sp. BPE23]|nr:hypothetical protein M9434_006989 [Picochlorum sp. BPE23]